MLFPQYAFKFEKVITADVWTYLKDEAQKRLADFNKDEDTANPQVVQHWKNIVGGKIPFGYVVKF